MRRVVTYRPARRLGWPVLPDQFNTASGASFSFSPQTPDATVVQILTQQGQQLPASLAAQWAAAQSGQQSSGAAGSAANAGNPTPAVTASGFPVSTQTGAGLTVTNIFSVAPGVFLWTMSDGSTHYADANGNPVSYTPPPIQPVMTPANTLPTSAVSPGVAQPSGVVPQFLGPPVQPPVGVQVPAVTASGQSISSTNGGVTQSVSPSLFNTSSIMSWLQGSMFGGIPNWVLVGGAALLLFSGNNPSRGRR